MAVFKCKMCGGALEVADGMTVCECEYCGTQQTLPKTDNEQILNMFNRANHFRQQCEFDKAADLYEKIAAQGDTDAELYWSLVLCRYGIEYVDDPKTKKKIATCHRTQFKSILDDPDYKAALDHADFIQRSIYEREAAYIDKIQKSILEISNKEQPFDVFICYKEVDERGRRTPDSVLAQELYYGLMQEGFKVFFSRITLESKLGAEYEPYIFAALNSAKVMVVVGTKAEHFNAVWVRNEWSRYLMIMQKDHNRTLIPAYKDMDAYDLPDELSMFQALDMSKLGFMQDLIRGISKLIKEEVAQPTDQSSDIQQMSSASNYQSLLKRAELFLEDGDWSSVKKYCNRVLDREPECATAYLYLLMAEKNITSEEKLLDIGYSLADNRNYKLAVRFADDKLRERLEGYVTGFEKKKKTAIENVSLFLQQKRDRTAKESIPKIQNEYDHLKTYLSQINNSILSKKCEIEKLNVNQLRAQNMEVNREISQLQEKCGILEKKIVELRQKASKMGFFQKAEKNRINSEIISLESTRQTYVNNIVLLKPKASKTSELLKQYVADKEALAGLEAEKRVIENQKIFVLQNKLAELQRESTFSRIVSEQEYRNSKIFLENLPDGTRPSISENIANYYKKSFTNERNVTLETMTFGGFEWFILSRTSDRITLLSKYIICEMKYNEKGVNWKNSMLRKWLNESFYNEFNTVEKSRIVKTYCENYLSSETEDYVYLLSRREAESMDNNNLSCNSRWWLRTLYTSTEVNAISQDGEIQSYAPTRELGIRPVITIVR